MPDQKRLCDTDCKFFMNTAVNRWLYLLLIYRERWCKKAGYGIKPENCKIGHLCVPLLERY